MQAASCSVHSTREAIGVCIACRNRVCSECSTKVEGINYCVSCLARLAEGDAARAAAAPLSPLRRRLGAVFWLVASVLIVWGTVELAFPGLE